MKKIILTFFIIAITCYSANNLFNEGNITLEGFQTSGKANDGSPWELVGEKAVIQGTHTAVSDFSVEMTLKNKEIAVFKSPECSYNQRTSVAESKSRIYLETPSMSMTGNGYNFYIKDQILKVHEDVHMKINISKAKAGNTEK